MNVRVEINLTLETPFGVTPTLEDFARFKERIQEAVGKVLTTPLEGFELKPGEIMLTTEDDSLYAQLRRSGVQRPAPDRDYTCAHNNPPGSPCSVCDLAGRYPR